MRYERDQLHRAIARDVSIETHEKHQVFRVEEGHGGRWPLVWVKFDKLVRTQLCRCLSIEEARSGIEVQRIGETGILQPRSLGIAVERRLAGSVGLVSLPATTLQRT